MIVESMRIASVVVVKVVTRPHSPHVSSGFVVRRLFPKLKLQLAIIELGAIWH